MRELTPMNSGCQTDDGDGLLTTEAATPAAGCDAVDIANIIDRLPKVELHVHLDGAFDPYQLWKHLEQNQALLQCLPVEKKLPWLDDEQPPLRLRSLVASCDSAEDFRSLCVCASISNEGAAKGLQSIRPSLERMLECFEVFLPLVNNNYELLETLAYAFVRKQHEQNVVYTEVRYSPHTFAAADARGAHAAITRGLRKGCAMYNVTVNQILCGINFRPDWAMEVVDMADELRDDFPCAVVGIDVAAGEDHFQPNSHAHIDHLRMCQRAKELGLNVTIHAGETPDSAENVHRAITHYGAQRIGHGYQIAHEPELLQKIKHANVHFEVCPTSSVQTGAWKVADWADHPACKLKENGFKISISSDDPEVFDTSLTRQFHIAFEKMGWDIDDIVQSLYHGIDAAFVADEEKDRLRQVVANATAVHM